MKVIGQTSGTVILETTKEEFANIVGECSRYDVDFKSIEGKNIEVSAIYKKHYELNKLLNQREYEKARNKLQVMLEILKPVDNLIESSKDLIKGEE